MALAESIIAVPTEFAEQCVERADGNPLFLEQLLRSAGEVGEGKIPGSIYSIVQARLDTLKQVDKRAIQAASVLGKRFNLADLRYMIDEQAYTCSGLMERSLVREEGEAYLFAHAMVQEAVYQSLLKSRRSELHKRAAERFDGHEPELYAVHLDRAGDSAAACAYHDAARIRMRDLQFKSVLELVARGMELAASSATRCDLMLVQAEALRNLGRIDESIALCEEARQIAGTGQQTCHAWLEQAEGLRIIDQQQPEREALDAAEAIAEEFALKPELSRIKYLRGNLYFMTGDLDGCLAEHQQSLQLAEETGSAEGRALALGGLGDAYYLRGAMHSAKDQFQACIDLCREHGFGRIEVANRNMVGWSRMYLLEFSQALEDAEASIDLAQRVSHYRAEMLSLELAGTIEFERVRLSEAGDYLERCLEHSIMLNAGNFIAQTYVLLARHRAALGDRDRAKDFIRQALDKVREVGMAFIGPTVLAVYAELEEDPAQRQSYLEEAEAILDEGCVSHNYFYFARAAIELSLTTGAWNEVERHAQRLEEYTAAEPLEWSVYIIARGRALAAWGKGDRDDALKQKITALHQQAVEAGWKRVLPALETALKE
jgi:tetratricopeptide (TPR) repeat protein